MKAILRQISIPVSALADKSITAGSKLLLWTIAYLTDEEGKWVVDTELIKELLGIEPNNFVHKLGDIEKAGYLNRQIVYAGKTVRYTVVYLTNKFKRLVKWDNGSDLKNLTPEQDNPDIYNISGEASDLKNLNHMDGSELKNLNHSEENEAKNPILEKEEPEEKRDINSNNNTIVLEKNKKIISSKTSFNKKEEKINGKLFTTMYSDKTPLGGKASIAKEMFVYVNDEFSKNGISESVSSLFKKYLGEMLSCRRVSGEDVKALVAQVIKFRDIYRYADDEIIDCIRESLMRRTLYIKPIYNLAEYRMRKAAAEDKRSDEGYNNPGGRKVEF